MFGDVDILTIHVEQNHSEICFEDFEDETESKNEKGNKNKNGIEKGIEIKDEIEKAYENVNDIEKGIENGNEAENNSDLMEQYKSKSGFNESEEIMLKGNEEISLKENESKNTAENIANKEKIEENVEEQNDKKLDFEEKIKKRESADFQCQVCEKFFQRRDVLLNHLRFVHAKIFTHECSGK